MKVAKLPHRFDHGATRQCVEDGTIPAAEAGDIFICTGVSIHWLAEDNSNIQDYNYQATKQSIQRAIARSPKAAEVVAKKSSVDHPFQAHSWFAGPRAAALGINRSIESISGIAAASSDGAI